MDYSKIYIDLMERSFYRNLEGYTEKHHIVPKCMGGDNLPRNIAILTPEEHFVAHQLLAKIYPKNPKVSYAAMAMTINNQFHIRNNKCYGWIRKKVVENSTGRKLPQETKRKISEANKGKTCFFKGKKLSEEHVRNIAEGNRGKKLSQEHKDIIGNSQRGKPKSEETKRKISESKMGSIPWNKNKKMPEEARLNNSKAQMGKKLSKEHIEKMIKTRKENGYKMSEETKEKIRQKATGRKHSEETKEKIRQINLKKNYDK